MFLNQENNSNQITELWGKMQRYLFLYLGKITILYITNYFLEGRNSYFKSHLLSKMIFTLKFTVENYTLEGIVLGSGYL